MLFGLFCLDVAGAVTLFRRQNQAHRRHVFNERKDLCSVLVGSLNEPAAVYKIKILIKDAVNMKLSRIMMAAVVAFGVFLQAQAILPLFSATLWGSKNYKGGNKQTLTVNRAYEL